MTREVDWLLEGAIPAGSLAVLMDADDGDPQAVLDAGADVVIHLGAADPATLSGEPFLFSILWRDGLVTGRRPPDPCWIRWTDGGFVFVEDGEAA